MHRRNLLHQLAAYRTRYPQEANTVDEFVDFVEREARCFERDCWVPGHITGSAWLVDPAGEALLLTHHKKLHMWLQLGGHADGEADVLKAAVREAEEESGVAVHALMTEILDIDIHRIPARKHDPEHLHFDVRFALQTAQTEVTVSDESHDLAWVPIDGLEARTREVSILRMRRKWRALRGAMLA